MLTLRNENDLRVMNVRIDDDRLSVDLMDGRTISAPLAWYPRLAAGTQAQRENWELCGAGMGIHWPDLDEDLSTEGLLMGAKGITRTLHYPDVAPRHLTLNADLRVGVFLNSNKELLIEPPGR